MKYATSGLLLLLCAVFAFSQTKTPPEYGKASELKGLKKIYLGVQSGMKDYNAIVKAFEKAKIPGLEIISNPDENADLIILFDSGFVEGGAQARTYGGVTTVNSVYYKSGGGMAAIPLKEGKVRILFEYSSTRVLRWQKKPAEKFAKEFIKAYKEANGLK